MHSLEEYCLYHGEDALHYAALDGNEAVVRQLITAGYRVNKKNKYNKNCTALHWAAENNHGGVADILVDSFADFVAQDDDGYTPLHFAVWCGHEAMVAKLASLFGTVNKQDKLGRGPLHIAAQLGHLEIVKELVRCHARINLQDNSGETPIFKAVRMRHREIYSFLNSQSTFSDVDCINNRGQTYYDVVIELADRDQEYYEMKELVESTVRLKRGGYLSSLRKHPSVDRLKKINDLFKEHGHLCVIKNLLEELNVVEKSA